LGVWNPGFTVPLDFQNPGSTVLLDLLTLGCSEPWYPWIFGTSGNSVSFCRYPWILGFYLCLSVPGTGGVCRSKGTNLDPWIFGFSVPSEIRYPLVSALGLSDSISAWRCRVPVESEDPGVPSVYWGFMRVVWFFRFSV